MVELRNVLAVGVEKKNNMKTQNTHTHKRSTHIQKREKEPRRARA
jgi:hypothetical protein